MQLSRPNPGIIALSFFVLIIIGSCTADEVRAQDPRGEIRVVESWRPDLTVLGYNVLQNLFEFALDRSEISHSLSVSHGWIDSTTLEVKLRQGVRFTNGEPFDADSVKFNFDYQRNHNPNRGIQIFLRSIKEIQVVDPSTVRMILNQPDALLPNRMVFPGFEIGWVIGAPRYMEKVGWDEFIKRPVGTGPYMVEGEMKDYRKVAEGEVYATLIANPDYWKKGYPKIRKISFVRYTPREAVRAVSEGHVDLVTNMIPKDTLKVAESPHAKVVKGRQDVRYTVGWLNLRSPHTVPLRDLRVRKALNYAVDNESLQHAFKGNAVEQRGLLTEKSSVELSETDPYRWDVERARELLEWAGYGEGFKMKLFYEEKDYLIAYLLRRFYSLLKIEVEITPIQWEWCERHVLYPNTRDGYSWEDEDWWIIITSQPSYGPEIMGIRFESAWHSGAPFQVSPDWLLLPLDRMYREVLRTTDRNTRFQIYKRANEYIADQALVLSTMAPLSLYGVNEEVDFVPQASQYLYLEYSSVTDRHWSVRGKNN